MFAEVILLDVPCFILNQSISIFILVVSLFFIYDINKKMETIFSPVVLQLLVSRL